jgi:hypothetical protein
VTLPQAGAGTSERDGRSGLLFVGDDWAEDHHDVELQDPAGRRLGRARLPEGVVGIARLHKLVAAQWGRMTGQSRW